MRLENTAFDAVLQISPEEFIKSWTSEPASTACPVGSSPAVQRESQELFAAVREAVSADTGLSRVDQSQ